MTRIGRALDWTFRNRSTGAITVGQWPNLPLWLFLGLSGERWAFDARGSHDGALRLAAGIALGWWAGDEVLRGVNPWRRALGAVTLAGLALAASRSAAGSPGAG